MEIVEGEEGKAGYVVKLKPKLDDETKSALRLREKQKKQQPAFRRQEWFRYKRLGESWRKPRGLHSKMRRNKKYRPPRVRVGYRKVKAVRGLHPSGFEDILVYNLKELQVLDPKTQAARIGGGVGYRKRKKLQDYAEENNIRVLNWVLEKVVVSSLEKLQELDPDTQAARIARDVSDTKRKELQDYARKHNIMVSNWKVVRK